MSEYAQELLESMLDRQRQSWLAGKPLSIAALLDGTPFSDDVDGQLDLIYNEIVLREEIGERPTIQEYAARYPHLQRDLELHFEVHQAISDPVLNQTARLDQLDTVPDDTTVAQTLWPNLDDYELLHILGQGGMGIVYQAQHKKLHRHVAIKMFRPGRLPSQRELLRFRVEAEAIARLQHPNIVQIFEVGQANGLPYLALELVDGGTLGDRLQKLPLAPRPAAELIETLARALHHAHKQQVVHRDLKPANILFTQDGAPKITDFGLAKVLIEEQGSDRDATRTGEPIGTPRYMSPEQAAGHHDAFGPATDVYALGTLLYECLTGQVPFVATSVVDTLARIRSEDPVSPRKLQPAVPRSLATICLHCLHKDPDRRYPSAEALADDLRRYRNGEPILARPTPEWERVWKWCRRRPARAAMIGMTFFLIVGGLAAKFIQEQRNEQRVEQLRSEVVALMQDGQAALSRDENEIAENRFRQALVIVRGEPRLRDFETGVLGWLDHSERAARKEVWKRVPPRDYDLHRDEAFLLAVLNANPAAARDAVRAAHDLTLPDDPAWNRERQQLAILECDLLLAKGDATQALARLDEEPLSSGIFHRKRAAVLEKLGRPEDAEVERRRVSTLPPDPVASAFWTGTEQIRAGRYAAAEREFARVLEAEPGHFLARLFQSICYLRMNRTAEARVGLIACTAQRERFAWGYFYLALAHARLGDFTWATDTCHKGLETGPSDAARAALEELARILVMHQIISGFSRIVPPLAAIKAMIPLPGFSIPVSEPR